MYVLCVSKRDIEVPLGQVEVITSNVLRSGYVPLVVNTSWSFPHSRLVTGFVTRLIRRMQQVDQELLTLQEHLSSLPILSGFVLLDLQLYMYVLQIVVCPFVLFHLVIVLSVRLRYTDSGYPFDIFKPFFEYHFILASDRYKYQT